MKQNTNSAVSEQLNTDPVGLPAFSGRKWSAHFDEPDLTSDAGLVAVAASGAGDRLLAAIAGAIKETLRCPDHGLAELVGQRVYQILVILWYQAIYPKFALARNACVSSVPPNN